jgi:hypothetical protein
LCAVPFLKARDWLCGKETQANRKPKLSGGMRAWVWDWIDGEWIEATRASLLLGRIVCVAASCGGYRTDRGFDPDSRAAVSAIPLPTIPKDVQALDEADDQQDGENLSYNERKTIACHSVEVANAVRDTGRSLGPSQRSPALGQATEFWIGGVSYIAGLVNAKAKNAAGRLGGLVGLPRLLLEPSIALAARHAAEQ